MQKKKFLFSRQAVDYYFDARLSDLKSLVPQNKGVIITDVHLAGLYAKKLKGWKVIVLKAGEQYKVQATVDRVMLELIEWGADRSTTLIGIGGGVITDLTGYIASTFLRGVPFGFVPTSLLAMVDASIGGKNGIDVGVYKNMVGTINQPRFLLFDPTVLKTLPEREWRNGFAEIIKHAAIKDAKLFRELEAATIRHYQKNGKALEALIRRNALIKTKVVQEDEFEKGERRLLNFGHTLAHAVETPYGLMHGEAVAIGMAFASGLSRDLLGFTHHERLLRLTEQYFLPVALDFDREKAFQVLRSDKKKEADFMNFVLLEKLGKARTERIPLTQLYQYL
ncbi:MAG TPA: 3-dehydroquinate synthase [Chitinophagaceae bacterium]|jgi:3-dehydroquinate synthase|nr:3-dehydroquinate synthase [Chitinophagaceae bacterium]